MQKRAIYYTIPKTREAEVWCPAKGEPVEVFFCQRKCGLYSHLYSAGEIICNWTQEDGAMDAEALMSGRLVGSLREEAICPTQ